MANDKDKFMNIGSYLLAKDGKTTYLKLEAAPKADEATKKLVEDLKKVVGGDVIYINRYDEEFRTKYSIPAFVKGRVSVSNAEGKKTEVDF